MESIDNSNIANSKVEDYEFEDIEVDLDNEFEEVEVKVKNICEDFKVGNASTQDSKDVKVEIKPKDVYVGEMDKKEAEDKAKNKTEHVAFKIEHESLEIKTKVKIEEGFGFVCDICSKHFHKEHSLKRHKWNIHTRTKRYPCTICEKTFTTSSNVKTHEVSHTGLKSHLCTTCGKAFSRLDSLGKHRMVHTKEKPYSCPNCPKVFSQSAHLKDHFYLHSAEKSFVCEKCSKAFAQPRSLRRHGLLHFPAKPFKCEMCDYSGNRPSQLATHHKRKHSYKNPHFCTICEEEFSRLDDFNSHILTHIQNTLEGSTQLNVNGQLFNLQ